MTQFPAAHTLGDLIAALADRYPNDVALRDAEGQVSTYAEFLERSRKLCGALDSRGLKPGARVAVLSKNRIEFAETFGLSRQGLVIVPLNWRLGQDGIRALLADCEPEVIFADKAHLDVIRSCLDVVPGVKVLVGYDGADGEFADYESLLNISGDEAPAYDAAPQDPLCIVYTSGTTGHPKGALISHAGALANMRAARAELLQVQQGDRVLAVMPFFHVGGLWYHFFASFASGCETIILPEFDPGTVLNVLERDRISVVHLVPTMIKALIEAEAFHKADLSSLRRIFYAASPMPTSLLRLAMGRLDACEFLQSYGSTETGVVAALSPEDHLGAVQGHNEKRLQSCGKPVPGCDIRISGAEGLQGPGEIGEIEVRGKGVFSGYWNNPEATQAIRTGDWLRTGDLGYADEAGYLFLVDRKNDMIVTGGENVYPAEVEEHLVQLDGVREAAVFGVPHPRWIEQVTAVVVAAPGTDLQADALIARLRDGLAHYKCPKQIHFAQTLPKNGVGKVLRARLREQFKAGEIA